MPAEDDPKGALVYAEALRGLDQQAAVVDSVRNRAGILLSAASIATSFLAGIALVGDRRLSGWGWAAAVSFVGVCAASMWILLPRREWKFTANAKDLVRDYVDAKDVTLARVHRNLALWAEQWTDANSRKIRRMFRWFEAGCFLLAADVAFWIVDLWRK